METIDMYGIPISESPKISDVISSRILCHYTFRAYICQYLSAWRSELAFHKFPYSTRNCPSVYLPTSFRIRASGTA